MAERKNKKAEKMVYTPEHHIPIGVACKTPSGEYALRIKKAKGDEVEVIPIGKLVTQVARAAEANA